MFQVATSAGLRGPAFVLLAGLLWAVSAPPGKAQVQEPIAERKVTLHPDFDDLWDYNDPAATEKAFREVLAKAQGKATADYRAQLLTQIARAQGLQQQFEAAHKTLNEAEQLMGPGTAVAKVRSLLEWGRVYNSAGEPEKSASYFMEALELADKLDFQYYAVDAAHMLGIVMPGDSGLEWTRRALSLAEEADEPKARKWRGSLYNNLGWTYFEMERYGEALPMFEQYLAVRTEEGNAGQIGIAQWSIAKTYRKLGRVNEALAMQQKLLEREDTRDNANEGYVREEIGECLLALDKPREAAPHFARAWELLHTDPWLSRDEPERLARLKKLGRIE